LYHDLTTKVAELIAKCGQNGIPTFKEPAPLSRDDHPQVRFWHRKAYVEWAALQKRDDDETDGLSTRKRRKPGRPKAREIDEDDDGSYPWLEMEDGSPVDAIRLAEMSVSFTRLMGTLHKAKMAAHSWGQNDYIASEFLLVGLSITFKEFRLCDGRWKLEEWLKKKYSGWARGKFEVRHTRKRKRGSDAGVEDTGNQGDTAS
jgi:hypothetical protein